MAVLNIAPFLALTAEVEPAGFDVLHEATSKPIVVDPPFPWGTFLQLFALGLIIVMSIVMAYYLRRIRPLRMFSKLSSQKGLTGEESDLMEHLLRVGRVDDPKLLFTNKVTFGAAAADFLQGMRNSNVSEDVIKSIVEMLDLVSRKLGLQKNLGTGSKTLLSTSQLRVGAEIVILPQDQGRNMHAFIKHNLATGMYIDFKEPPTVELTGLVRACHYDGGAGWEFESQIIKTEDGSYFMSHCDNPKFVSRRAFPRIPVDYPAMIAHYAFAEFELGQSSLTLVPARLVEIAGPGLMMETEGAFPSGGKAFVKVQLQPTLVVSGTGKVHRSKVQTNGKTRIVIELKGLDEAEMSVLRDQTNMAAIKSFESFGPSRTVDAVEEMQEDTTTDAGDGEASAKPPTPDK